MGAVQPLQPGGGSSGPPGPSTTTIPQAYGNASSGPQLVTLDATRGAIYIDGVNISVPLTQRRDAFYVENSAITDPGSGAVVRAGFNSNGEMDFYFTNSVGQIGRLSGGSDDGAGFATVWDNGFMTMPPPTAAAANLPASQLLLRAADGIFAGAACGGVNMMAGLPGAGGTSAGCFVGQPAGTQFAGNFHVVDLTKPHLYSGSQTEGPTIYGGGISVQLQAGSSPDLILLLGPNPQTVLGGLQLTFGAHDQFDVASNAFRYVGYGASFNNGVLVWFDTNNDFSGDDTFPLFQISTAGTKVRMQVFGSPSGPNGAVKILGTIGDTSGAQLMVSATTETSTYKGAAIQLDAIAVGGQAWRILNIHDAIVGADSLYILSQRGGGNGIVMKQDGSFLPFLNNTNDFGAASLAWKDGYFSGKLKLYNSETMAGIGVLYTLAVAQDVASAGGGGQATSIVTLGATLGGLYRVDVTASSTTADAAVTVGVGWTDGVNSTAVVKSALNAVALAGNDAAFGSVILRSQMTTGIAVTCTLSSQATTKFSATITRLE